MGECFALLTTAALLTWLAWVAVAQPEPRVAWEANLRGPGDPPDARILYEGQGGSTGG